MGVYVQDYFLAVRSSFLESCCRRKVAKQTVET